MQQTVSTSMWQARSARGRGPADGKTTAGTRVPTGLHPCD
jgi:hypothetical protein